MGIIPSNAWPKRGEIYLVNFDPAVGSEIQKTRPAIILQNDLGNEYSATTIVAAITAASGGHRYPTEVGIAHGQGGLDRDSLIVLNQLRTVDKSRLIHKLGSASKSTMQAVGAALLISLGVIKIS